MCHRPPCLAVSALISLIFLVGGQPGPAQGTASSEHQVKAAFLYHFSQFVDWPEGTFKEASSPLTYCTLGEDPFQGALEASLNGKTVGTRPIRVLHFKQQKDIQGCQVLFIGPVEKRALSGVLASLKDNAVLTVGESDQFVETGGMIGFLLEDNKIRFEINLEAAERAKLKMSSRLLALAKTVIGGHRGT